MVKITYIISDIDKSLGFEWVARHLDRGKFRLEFILLNRGGSRLEEFLKAESIPVRRIRLRSGAGMILTFASLWWILVRKRPRIIHTHLRFGTLLGIPAGWLGGVRHRIHTRHHADFNHVDFPHAVGQDKWLNRLSTRIVSISDRVTEILMEREGVPRDKIVKIHHGFDLELFSAPDPERVAALREKYIPRGAGPVVGVISRYTKLKGIEYIIDAFGTVRSEYPKAHLVLANASGPDAGVIRTRLAGLPEGSYTEIAFEPDIAALYQIFDVFVHVPVRPHAEAFGQTYIEAMAAGVPSVFTLSGVAGEVVVDRKNALVVPFENAEAIGAALLELLGNPDLYLTLVQHGKKTVESFSLEIFIQGLEQLYLSESGKFA